jgi:hypothetical protein
MTLDTSHSTSYYAILFKKRGPVMCRVIDDVASII